MDTLAGITFYAKSTSFTDGVHHSGILWSLETGDGGQFCVERHGVKVNFQFLTSLSRMNQMVFSFCNKSLTLYLAQVTYQIVKLIGHVPDFPTICFL